AKTGGPRSLEHLEQAESTIDSAINQLRSLARSLRPPVLDDRGLAGAIQQFADSMRTPVEVHARVEHPLTAIVELVAYRIAIEALVNAERHADATLIGVDITTHPTGLALDVVDNGVGLRAAPAARVGLVSLRDRAAEVGGRCDLVPSDPQGTHVRLRIPSITALTR